MKELLLKQLQTIQKEKELSMSHPLLYVWLVLRLMQLAKSWLSARWMLRNSEQLGRLVFAKGPLKTYIYGCLTIGERVRFWSTIHPSHLHVSQNATLNIGSDCFINGALIAAYKNIQIGNGVYIAPMAQISDSYAFGLPSAGEAEQVAAIIIEDNVWVATRAIILPGVRIGKSAVIGVGAVVSKDVPPFTVVGGVPAKVIKILKQGDSLERISLKV